MLGALQFKGAHHVGAGLGSDVGTSGSVEQANSEEYSGLEE